MLQPRHLSLSIKFSLRLSLCARQHVCVLPRRKSANTAPASHCPSGRPIGLSSQSSMASLTVRGFHPGSAALSLSSFSPESSGRSAAWPALLVVTGLMSALSSGLAVAPGRALRASTTAWPKSVRASTWWGRGSE